jgi:aminopeptidase C
VELRHAATHDTLPGIEALRSATHQALAWLHDNYWREKVGQEGSANALQQWLHAYKQVQKQVIKGEATEEMAITALDSIVDFVMDVDMRRAALVKALLAVGWLVPLSKKYHQTL